MFAGSVPFRVIAALRGCWRLSKSRTAKRQSLRIRSQFDTMSGLVQSAMKFCPVGFYCPVGHVQL